MSWRSIQRWPLTPRSIVAMAKEYSPVCGVYFLVKGDDVIYVGQSVNVPARVATHKNNGVEFERWHFIECEPEWLNDLEAAFIAQFSPSLNKTHCSGHQYSFARGANLKIQIEIDRWWSLTPTQRMAEMTPNAPGKPTAANELNEGEKA